MPSPEWLTAAHTSKLMAVFNAVRPDCARFVGGCVRNTIMHHVVDDIDIATQLEPAAVLAALEAADIRAIPTGLDHGTVTAIVDGTSFEITSLRRDVSTDGRRAVVAFTEDWEEDARRRDFRLNAIYMTAEGQIWDPFNGVDDARRRQVVFIGDADQRLREDYLRILRFFRFNAWYGGGIDPGGLAACQRHRDGLEQIAQERIWKEMQKLLAAPDPLPSVRAMLDSNVLSKIIGACQHDLVGLQTLLHNERNLGLSPDPVRRLMTLVPRQERDALDLSARLKLPNKARDRLRQWTAITLPAVNKSDRSLSIPDLSRLLYWHGCVAVLDRVLTDSGNDRCVPDAALVEFCSNWQRPSFPVSGDDALAAGLSGAKIGQALKRLEHDWVKSNFQLSRSSLLPKLRD
ncbi:MAG: CCA tRNA nucleotidyltransferase [Henriciella sp.]